MVFKCSEGVRGSQEERGERKCRRMPSPLLVGRNEFANFVRSQMCGRGGVAGDAALTSRQGRRLENGQRAPHRRAERRIGTLKVRRQRLRSFGPKLRRRTAGRANPSPRRESGMEEERGMEVEIEIESRKKFGWAKEEVGERVAGAWKNSRVCRKRFRTASRMTRSSSCRRWSKGGGYGRKVIITSLTSGPHPSGPPLFWVWALRLGVHRLRCFACVCFGCVLRLRVLRLKEDCSGGN